MLDAAAGTRAARARAFIVAGLVIGLLLGIAAFFEVTRITGFLTGVVAGDHQRHSVPDYRRAADCGLQSLTRGGRVPAGLLLRGNLAATEEVSSMARRRSIRWKPPRTCTRH